MNLPVFLAVLFLTVVAPQALGAEPVLVDRIAAVVNDEIILYTEVEQTASSYMERLRSVTDPVRRERLAEEINEQTLDRMIDEKILEQQIKELKYTVAESEVDSNIKGVMTQNGIPDIATLKEVLEKQGIRWSEYRKQVRKSIKRWQFISAKVGGRVKITEEDVKTEYDKQVSRQKKEYEYRARHILVKSPEGALPEEELAARNKLLDIRRRLDQAEDFGELAKKYSQNPFSAKSGGDLGWIKGGITVPEFDRVLRALKVGEISDVVWTRFGYQIIQLQELREIPPEPFEAQKEKIKTQLREDESNRLMTSWLKELRKKSFVKVMLTDPPARPDKDPKKDKVETKIGEAAAKPTDAKPEAAPAPEKKDEKVEEKKDEPVK